MPQARFERSVRRLAPVIAALAVLCLPVASSGQIVPSAGVVVCQVTGSVNAPHFAQVQVSLDQLAAYLNQFPGSFLGSCPAPSGGSGDTTTPLRGAVTVCRVSGSASAPLFTEILVAAEQVAAYLNANPGSFSGACPAAGAGGNSGQGSGGTGPVNAVVTVCQISGSVNAPRLAQLTLAVERVAAFLNRNPGSFIGTCPGDEAYVAHGPGRILGIPVGAALAVCKVTAGAKALGLVQLNVAIDRLAAFLNQNPGSFVGLCPSSGDLGGTIGNEPLGYVTICRVTGHGHTPLAPITIRHDRLEAYLAQPGTIIPAPTAGCPKVETPSDDGGAPPSTTHPGETKTVFVHTTPDTVVTAKGAGVEESARSDKKGKATLKVKPKRKGIVTVRGAGGRVVQRIGVAPAHRSGRNLTG